VESLVTLLYPMSRYTKYTKYTFHHIQVNLNVSVVVVCRIPLCGLFILLFFMFVNTGSCCVIWISPLFPVQVVDLLISSVTWVHTFFVYRGYSPLYSDVRDLVTAYVIYTVESNVYRTSRWYFRYWLGVLLRMALCRVAFSVSCYFSVSDVVWAGAGRVYLAGGTLRLNVWE
jgi:hypothetical protein